MAKELIGPAVLAALAGALLAFGTYGVLDAGGPAKREEATVETRGQHVDSQAGHLYDLAVRTASGERFEVSSHDAGLDLEPGLPVGLEISEVGRSVQAVEAGGHRIPAGDSAVGLGVIVGLYAAMLLAWGLAIAVVTGRLGAAALSMTAGLAVGALPVWLLF
ncbi:hypothetical protein [Amycolatopsis vastitatis]|uniref:Uncharacterized protein n=1 Tax=Amycolatopsis vastitatis TaxID=1905142 RepID=A0A229T758_9PSEU|nr:hypothetical protein [Amycolatopsis vastitatis]OXM66933.1 hypothetical protein CF165_19390 [Amycolatopsis vastitatis]